MILSDGVITLRPRTLSDVDAHMAGHDQLYEQWLQWDPPRRESVTAMVDTVSIDRFVRPIR
jgi:hypothetical protein